MITGNFTFDVSSVDVVGFTLSAEEDAFVPLFFPSSLAGVE